MPEISQDKFESENPAMAMHTGAITSFDSIRGRTNSTEKGALALRSRANSSGRLKNVSFPPKIQRLSSCVSENDFESYMEGIHMQEPSWVDDRELAHRYVPTPFSSFLCRVVALTSVKVRLAL
ncbi:hypothetical protein PPYR_14872 [Photinus pyralis]|uniref:Uncharacterized protein n=1 Tax=Photinus pyralis TaxID=7054 RepID=A0A5N4A0M6_PHOPY|nr:hypothetical protein PPYR_14872 [Photinus pyralis]